MLAWQGQAAESSHPCALLLTTFGFLRFDPTAGYKPEYLAIRQVSTQRTVTQSTSESFLRKPYPSFLDVTLQMPASHQ